MSDVSSLGRCDRRRRRKLVIALVLVAALSAIVGGRIAMEGIRVTRTEFSPETFTHRTISYIEIPFTSVPASTPTLREWTTPLDDYLREQGFVTPFLGEPTWHFVRGRRPGYRGWIGGGRSACNALSCNLPTANTELVAWSKAHPEHARILWPMVVAVSRQQLYLIPYLVELRHSGADIPAEEFRARLLAELARITSR